MAREIQWDEVRVERALTDMDTTAEWTALGPRTWSVLQRRALQSGMRVGPDAEGHLFIPSTACVARCVLGERAKLLEKMGMSVSAGAAQGHRGAHAWQGVAGLGQAGDVVEEGQALLVLEAMKMENMIKAVAAGKFLSFRAEGEAVEKGALLVG